MAAYLGLGDTAYRKYESAQTEPNSNNLIKLADFFGVSIDYLLCRDNAPTPDEVVKRLSLKEDLDKRKKEMIAEFIKLDDETQLKTLEFIKTRMEALKAENGLDSSSGISAEKKTVDTATGEYYIHVAAFGGGAGVVKTTAEKEAEILASKDLPENHFD